jgi:RNase P/RNase MRP subunit POP5
MNHTTKAETAMKTSRHRYIAIQAIKFPRVEDSKSSLVEAILSKLRERSKPEEPIGFRFRVIEYDDASSKGIVRITPHTAIEKTKKLISSINQIHGQPLEMHILGTSGTIKALRRKYMIKQSQSIPKVIKVIDRMY